MCLVAFVVLISLFLGNNYGLAFTGPNLVTTKNDCVGLASKQWQKRLDPTSSTVVAASYEKFASIKRVKSISSSNQSTRLCNTAKDSLEEAVDSENSVKDAGFTTPLDRPGLAILDLVALLVFAAIGKASHTSTESLLSEINSVLITAAPFILSWYVTSPITGVYNTSSNDKNGAIQSSIMQTAKGWIVAIPIGCAIRGIIKGYVPPVPFVIVTMIATAILLIVSRLVYSFVRSR